SLHSSYFFIFLFNASPTTEIYTLSLHDALPIFKFRRPPGLDEPEIKVFVGPINFIAYNRIASRGQMHTNLMSAAGERNGANQTRSEEHTSELQSRGHLVCRLLLEKKKKKKKRHVCRQHRLSDPVSSVTWTRSKPSLNQLPGLPRPTTQHVYRPFSPLWPYIRSL